MLKQLQYSVYKGTGGSFGALQFNLQDPHYYEVSSKKRDFTGNQALNAEGKLNEGWRIREGAIFLEATSAKGKNVYDWENKIVMALSITDMGKLALALATGEDPRIIHDPNAKTATQGTVTKSLTMYSKNGTAKGALITIGMKAGNQLTEHKVPITGDEVIVLGQLLRTAMSRALNW